jgi:FAD:protein FMN transferase
MRRTVVRSAAAASLALAAVVGLGAHQQRSTTSTSATGTAAGAASRSSSSTCGTTLSSGSGLLPRDDVGLVMATAGTEWELWSTRARLVVTDPGVLFPARQLVDSYLADGDVDPTVGAAMPRLGYDRDLQLVEDGDGPVVAVARPVPGHRHLRLEGPACTSRPASSSTSAPRPRPRPADRCAGIVRGSRSPRAGQPRRRHRHGRSRAGWRLADPCPGRDDDPWTQVALPAGRAVATSSTVSRQWRRGGRTLHHIVDPRTGQPARRVWRSVTVATDTCVLLTDGWPRGVAA